MKVLNIPAFTMIFILLNLGASIALGTPSQCLGVPNDQNPVIYACESRDSYIFKLPAGDKTFDKQYMVHQISAGILEWWINQGLDLSDICTAKVAYWVSVPDGNPDGTAARILVDTPIGSVLFSTILEPQVFHPTDESVAIFPLQQYPNSFGIRTKSLLAKALPNAAPEEVEALAFAAGATSVQEIAPNWYHLVTRPFKEISARDQLINLNQSTHLLDRVDANQIYEWLAFRRHVFTMQVDCKTIM